MALTVFPNEQNFIKSVLTHPCARPWFIYVETFAPAFLKLFVTVALFDFLDAIRARGTKLTRQKGVRSGKKHSKKVRLSAKAIQEERYMQKGLKFLLIITEPLEKIGFLWLLYSAVDEFFLDWQTLLEESDYCVDKGQAGPLTLQRGVGFISLVVGGVPVILNLEKQDRAGWPHSDIGATLPFGRFSAVFGLTVKAPSSGVTGLWIRLTTLGSFGSQSTQSDPITLGPNQEGSLALRHDFHYPFVGGGPLVWEIGGATIPAGIEAQKGHMSVFRNL